MSSTNKTTNYELSQFIGTDKPAWLSDYNADMGKIDTGIHNAQTTATGADGKADANASSIGTLSNLTTTAKTNIVSAINEVDADTGTAQNTANTAVNTANTASANVTALKNKFDLSTNLDYTNATMTVTNATLFNDSHLFVARNSDGSLYKIYGRFGFTLTGGDSSNVKITIANTGIPVTTQYQIICAGMCWDAQNISEGIQAITLTIKNGTIEIEARGKFNGHSHIMQLHPCLYFNSNFGDLPTPE